MFARGTRPSRITTSTPACQGFNAAFPDWEWETVSLTVNGDTVILEAIERGHWTEPLVMAPGLVLQDPTGEFYEDHDADFFLVKDGLITEIRTYITNRFASVYQIERRVAAVMARAADPIAP